MRIIEADFDIPEGDRGQLAAYVNIVISGELGGRSVKFAIRDMRLIRDHGDGFFIQMPSRPTTHRCKNCNRRNPHESQYCGSCGFMMPACALPVNSRNRPITHFDLFYPIDKDSRAAITEDVVKRFTDFVRVKNLT